MGVHVDEAPLSSPVDADVAFGDGARVIQFPSPRSAARATSAALDHSAAIERMADATMRLARRNEALEDFAALVAHELKTPLETALLADEPRRWIVSALDLVDSLLEAASESPDGAWASLADCVAEAAGSLAQVEVTVADDNAVFPLPSRSLSVILRNLLANAGSAKARCVDVFAGHRGAQWWLVVDDDGVGLGSSEEGYDHGSGIGLELCRRIARRNGGRLELIRRQAGGTRAILTMERAA
jgi:signal transduction histidine kinase